MPSSFFIGLDFGTKKVGVAIGQLITKTSTALPIIYYRSAVELWKQLDILVNTWSPKGLVVGIPYRLDGSQSTITPNTLAFFEQLKKHFTIPVYCSDEALTSLTARNYLKSKYPNKKITKIDSYAACLILEGWLNQNALLDSA